MEKSSSVFLCLLLFLLLGNEGVEAVGALHTQSRDLGDFKPSRLFVFGDSYADTGNNRKIFSSSWKLPYGITFPGKPAGRFSDGRVLTDYLARFLGIKSPIAYRWRQFAPKRLLQSGVNFAYGGTGVFNTFVPEPNMTTQIDFFHQLVYDAVYSWQDLQSSVALVAVSGNDYGVFTAQNGSAQGLQSFIPLVVNQLALNLNRIRSMGIKKVVVTSLQPLGCLPRSTIRSSFQTCNDTENMAVTYHNLLLHQAVDKLNNETGNLAFVYLDLYTSFLSVLKNQGNHPGSTNFVNPLKPCCVGLSSGYSCGSVGINGEKQYTVCNQPETAFFWDTVHPTQEGWGAVYLALRGTLEQIYQYF